MEEAKESQKTTPAARQDQLLTELLLRISALEKVLMDKEVVTPEELKFAVKNSLTQLVTAMAASGLIKDAEVVLTSIDKNI